MTGKGRAIQGAEAVRHFVRALSFLYVFIRVYLHDSRAVLLWQAMRLPYDICFG